MNQKIKYTPRMIRDTWNSKYEWDRYNIINNELQHYSEVNARFHNILEAVNGDILQITARQESAVGPFHTSEGPKWDAQPYTSAMFQSQDKAFATTGDYVEFYAKLPSEEGCFPAGWLLRRDPVWAKTEIDVFEGIHDVNEGNYHIAHHSHTAEGGTYQKMGQTIKTGENLTEEYHRYGVHIQEHHLDYYFDRKLVGSVPLHDHEKNLEYYMLFNLAVAGEGTWAAGDATFPYNWPEGRADLYLLEIGVYDGVPSPVLNTIISVDEALLPETELDIILDGLDEDLKDALPDDVFDAPYPEPVKKKKDNIFLRIIKSFLSALRLR